MSELESPPALRQLDALAAWLLLGWLGQRLGWSFASGVLPVVVWWTVRCSGGAFSALVGPLKVWPPAGAAGLLALLPLLPAGPAALAVLLLAAALWGCWSASLARAAGDTMPTLPGQAMGLMMGSLWLGSQWCLGPGWSDAQSVTLHLALMGLGPFVADLALRAAPCRSPRLAASLLAAGALLMALPVGTAARVAGMVLMALAWSLGLDRHTPSAARPPRGMQGPGVGLGPVLLLAAGGLAPTLGPLAMQLAWSVVALLALAALLPGRDRAPAASLPSPRWSDVS